MKRETLKKIIGLQQEEMAMLLGVTRTQWSLFEIGKRGIPLEATKKLGTLLQHLKNNEQVCEETLKVTALEQQKVKDWYKRELRKVEYKRLVLEKKILAMKNKREECFAALEVAAFLASQAETEWDASLASLIKSRVLNVLNKNALHHLEDMQMKKKELEGLKTDLEQKMKQNENNNSTDSFI